MEWISVKDRLCPKCYDELRDELSGNTIATGSHETYR